jgi:hypothetical protein
MLPVATAAGRRVHYVRGRWQGRVRDVEMVWSRRRRRPEAPDSAGRGPAERVLSVAREWARRW